MFAKPDADAALTSGGGGGGGAAANNNNNNNTAGAGGGGGGGGDTESAAFVMPHAQSKDHLFFNLLDMRDDQPISAGGGGGGSGGGAVSTSKHRKRALTSEQRRALDDREAERAAEVKRQALTRDLVVCGYHSLIFNEPNTARALEAGNQLLLWRGSGAPPSTASAASDASNADASDSAVDDSSVPLRIDRFDVRALLTEYSAFEYRAHFSTTQHYQYLWCEESGRTAAERSAQGREDDSIQIEEEGRSASTAAGSGGSGGMKRSGESDIDRDLRWQKRTALLDTLLDEERYRDLPADEESQPFEADEPTDSLNGKNCYRRQLPSLFLHVLVSTHHNHGQIKPANTRIGDRPIDRLI